MKKAIFLIPAIFIFLGFYLWQGIYVAGGEKGEEEFFTVKKGQGLFEVGRELEKQGLIENRLFFDIYVLLKKNQSKLQAGSYRLDSSMNVPQIAGKIISGDIAKIIVTIPEGFTKKEIEERLGFELPGEDLEGFLFPDTYEFQAGISAEEAIKIMRDNFNEKLTVDLYNEIVRQKKTVLQVVTMASLLEKEVKTEEEKKVAAGILWKRLAIGMLLQVDAAPETYELLGLPTSPVSNPGLESIKAAIYPKESQYWYYLSTKDGQTLFSRTLEEHNIKKAKYLK